MIAIDAGRPLRVAVLVKQVPALEELDLGADGRLERTGRPTEIDAYGRRAAALGVQIAQARGGECVAVTMGPAGAVDVLRECLAGGVDRGVLLSDPALAGSDSLATARALEAVLRAEGPFDLILAGRAAVDADTGQVPPQLAEHLGLAFAGGARTAELRGEQLLLGLEHDDRWLDVEVDLPAVVTCAERLCDPLKLKDPAGWPPANDPRIEVRDATSLGDGPWGEAASPTWVARVDEVIVERDRRILDATADLTPDSIDAVARRAVELLVERGALDERERRLHASVPAPAHAPGPSPIGVVLEPGRVGPDGELDALAIELLGAAATLAVGRPSRVVALVADRVQADSTSADGAPASASPDALALGGAGADDVRTWPAGANPAQVASAVARWAAQEGAWALLLGGTDWGREVGARAAARNLAGMTGDAIALAVDDDRSLVARKAAFGGGAEAVIGCRTALHVASVRPGVLPTLEPRPGVAALAGDPLEVPVDSSRARPPRVPAGSGPATWVQTPPERDGLPATPAPTILATRAEDDAHLATAARVVGVGQGVAPDELALLDELVALLGAEVAATRKVTDAGWLPRARQLGVTGHAIAPVLYVAVGIGGKVTHTAGVRRAGTILAVNLDPAAPIFDVADVGIVGDWRTVAPALVAALRTELAR